ncbi:BTB/POZ domain-containing protein 6-like [Montipora capricornis]|uniref:BTB/POZ domain-containing protein 6-like n=1 Tax=Montipora capricornis TaxID=246305 RepID=UPI0035F0FAA3
MSLREENWQTKKPTIRERTKFMFNNGLFSDVKFVVRKSDGETESKQAIPAHKLVLSIGSPVFEAMFYGDLAETRDCIELPDCEYESLLELFRYLYSDEVNLSGSNVMEVLYLAKKYIVPSLAAKCTKYLQDRLDPSNVFNILQSARKYDEEQLVDRCWEVIDKQTEAALKSEGFAVIDRPLLEELVERDTLNIQEVELFKGVVQWADKEVARQAMVADGQEKRKI